MAYNRYSNNRGPRAKLVTDDDIGKHVTLVVRIQPKGTMYVSGVVKAVTSAVVTLGVMHHPTGPWDKWQSYEGITAIEHKRITRRA